MKTFLRRVAVMAAAATSVIATAASPAAAAIESGGVVRDANGWCHFEIWNGTFHCNTNARWDKPDLHDQVFVIGRDNSVYTKLRRDGGTSDWSSMGGKCSPSQRIIATSRPNSWSVVVSCQGLHDGKDWYRKRFVDGSWSPQWIQGWTTPD